MTEEPLATIEIPRYLTKIKVSKARRAKYYKKGSKNIPKKYRGEGYTFDKRGFLIGPDGNRVVANPRTAGKPRYETLSGNKLTSGYATPFTRNKISSALKDFYRPFVRQLEPLGLEDFPIRIEWDFYTTVDVANFDMGNFWFYYKYFEDSLHETEDHRGNTFEPIIPDDNVRYVTHPPGPRLFPVDDFEDRRFVFRIYSDRRPELLQHELWNPTCESSSSVAL